VHLVGPYYARGTYCLKAHDIYCKYYHQIRVYVQQPLVGDHLCRQANYTDFVSRFYNFIATKTVNIEQRAQTQTTHTNYEPMKYFSETVHSLLPLVEKVGNTISVT